jgi:hypothetical protein
MSPILSSICFEIRVRWFLSRSRSLIADRPMAVASPRCQGLNDSTLVCIRTVNRRPCQYRFSFLFHFGTGMNFNSIFIQFFFDSSDFCFNYIWYCNYNDILGLQYFCFDLYFRKNSFGGEYTVFAGLEECIHFVANFKLSGDVSRTPWITMVCNIDNQPKAESVALSWKSFGFFFSGACLL